MVHQLLLTTREQSVADMEGSFQREDQQRKPRMVTEYPHFIEVHCSIPSLLREFPNGKPDHLFLCLSLPTVAE